LKNVSVCSFGILSLKFIMGNYWGFIFCKKYRKNV